MCAQPKLVVPKESEWKGPCPISEVSLCFDSPSLPSLPSPPLSLPSLPSLPLPSSFVVVDIEWLIVAWCCFEVGVLLVCMYALSVVLSGIWAAWGHCSDVTGAACAACAVDVNAGEQKGKGYQRVGFFINLARVPQDVTKLVHTAVLVPL